MISLNGLILSVNDLRNLFDFSKKPEPLFVTAKCCICGRKTTIEIHRTSGGFGFLGGVLYKSANKQHIVKCAKCYKAEPFIDLTNWQPSKQVAEIESS